MLYREFEQQLQAFIPHGKNIILFGGGNGGDYVRWFCEKNGDYVKAWIDRWNLSDRYTVPHLWSLAYIHDDGDILVNCTNKDIVAEYNDTGEIFENTGYTRSDIVDLWARLYESKSRREPSGDKYPEITYYDWLEWKYGVDLLNVIRRKDTDGDFAHGYFPTDTRIFIDIIKNYPLNSKDAVLDIGAGKGSGVVSLSAAGFSNIGAIEYTKSIFDTLCANMNRLNMKDVQLLYGDAAELTEELDKYNWFFLFNPFDWKTMEKILANLSDSIRRRKRKIRIIYAEPIFHNMIMSSGKYKLIYKNENDYSNVSYYTYVYESTVDSNY